MSEETNENNLEAETQAAAVASTEQGDGAEDVENVGGEVDGAAAAEAKALEAISDPRFKWYVVHTYSMYEEKAKQALLERIKQNNVEEYFGEILVPKIATEQVLKSGKKKRVERTSFPGYIIVQMDMNESTNHIVTNTPKITGFVGNARKPRPVSDREVLKLTSPDIVMEQKKSEAAVLSFEEGETVKVIDGAFTNFDGVVEQVQADKMKLRILVSIFGRQTPVELEYSQVQKIT